MDSALSTRIDAMLRRDIWIGVAFAALMWIVLIFTFVNAARVIDDGAVTTVVAIACALLGVFNTLAMLSMVRLYRAEREHIYTEDIHYLDAARKARSAAAGGGAA